MSINAISRRALLAAGAGLPLAAAAFGRAGAQTARPTIVVELFTSQGCNSCPPADGLLGDLTKRADVLALSFHVDYWDYIGWKDPYASPDFTARQRGYAKSLKQRYVYTPEMVVHGYAHDSGLDRSTVLGLIADAPARVGPQINPGLSIDRGGMVIAMPEFAPLDGGAELWLASFDPMRKTKVERGENRGRELVNYHVARSLVSLGEWNGKARQMRVGADRLGSGSQIALLVQKSDLGPILGFANLQRLA